MSERGETIRDTNDLDGAIAKKIQDECNGSDIYAAHLAADQHLIDLLGQLGFPRVVEAWEAAEKWYA